jgi:zinc D-Ala-D-Ala carboxypeptidase
VVKEKISPHITYAEGVVSATAKRLGIENVPSAKILETMKTTAQALFEPVRCALGKPIEIISFYRCEKLNKAVGGSKNSQHMIGEAIDVRGLGDLTNAEIYYYIKESGLDFDQIIWEFGNAIEPDWVHISYTTRRKNRKQRLRAIKLGGKTQYVGGA